MTPEQKKIYLFITENPNSKVIDVVMATKLSKSLCYKFLNKDHFIKTKVVSKQGQYTTYVVNDMQVISNYLIPRHHYIHQAFWRIAA